ncbi:MAG: TlpA disulfide reductase family protein [Chloroflexota bacterium]
MGVTAAIIAALAFMANQPSAGADGFTSVTLSGGASGEPPTVGEAAPDLLATTVDEKTVRLSDLKGKPVWLTFGASWCQPCRAENPDIQAMSEEFADSDLIVLAIFIAEDASAVRDYADRVGLTYRKVADPDTRIASDYRIMGIPSHYFIDRSGVLRLMKIGGLDPAVMEAALNGVLE